MISEIIEYKGKKYVVTNPGELVYSTTQYVRGCRTDMRYEILDQLDGCSEIKYTHEYSSRVNYLKNKYNLSELDYYIIVVCRGNESLLPRCTYVNPYTKETCNKPQKFRSLTPGKFQKTGKRKGIFHDGCEDHAGQAAAQNAQRENYKRGVTGLQKADRKSKVWREKLSIHAKKQMNEGRSIFSPDEIRDKDIPSWKTLGSNPSMSYYREIANTLGINEYTFSIESCILIDKLNYMKIGNPDDVCYYYIAYIKENPQWFKLGVTKDLNNRINTGYHGYTYESTRILFK